MMPFPIAASQFFPQRRSGGSFDGSKIKYRPVIFELMPPDFTLTELQTAVEAISGRHLHKQNFRRLMEQQELVEETGAMTAGAAGRPAKLFRFRRNVMLERAIVGNKLPLARSH